MNLEDLSLYFYRYADHYALLFPIGVIGLWRWLVWLIKEIVGLYYQPDTTPYKAKVSLVTPVYNEDPEVFLRALRSWKANAPDEIIAVIDHTDTRCIKIFKNFAENNRTYKLIVTKTPGKRPALADGIKRAKYPIVALVDSDTIWSHDVIKNGLCPFNKKEVAGVATYQNVLQPKTFAQKVFDIQLDIRYRLEYVFLAAAGDALTCLSGRTAFYRRSVIVPMLPELVHETFMGQPVISGDDKRLTYLVLAAGWKVAYQSTSHVYTPGMRSLPDYTRQRLRWTRNALRADIRALLEGWPLRHPALFFFQIDKVLQSFVTVLSPLFLLVSLFAHLWLSAAVIVAWWLLSRTIKTLPHLSRRPQDIIVVPGYIIYSFFVGVLKIYAFFSLNTQGWITRWDTSRLPHAKSLHRAFAYTATGFVILLLYGGVYMLKDITYFKPQAQKRAVLASSLRTSTDLASAKTPSVLGAATETKKDFSVGRYESVAGDTLYSIAAKLKIDSTRLLNANIAKIPMWWSLRPGTIFSVPGADVQVQPSSVYNYRRVYPPALTLEYEKETDTMVVQGRGHHVTLKTLSNYFGKDYLEELPNKEWHLKSSIYVGNGVTLFLKKSEVTWLKLYSRPNDFAVIRGNDADIVIDGVRVTSWDPIEKTYDTNMDDGRSFVFVKGSGRLDLYNSELAYLGFPTSEEIIVSPYGVSWKVSRQDLKKIMLTGEVIGSTFHHNYFGAYTYGATGMTWRGNEFFENYRYGLDPHDDSNGFLIEKNVAHDNGTHGIILSKRCMYNVIRENYSYNNKLHGIMLHEKSDYNEVYGNVLAGNTSGIVLWRSGNNSVYNNRLENNRHGIRINMAANNNVVEKNIVTGSKLYGIYIYDEALKNSIRNNALSGNDVALYVRSPQNIFADNTIVGNRTGVYFTDNASGNSLVNNVINNNAAYGIYSKVSEGIHNVINGNTLLKNRKDVTARREE